ncbi:tetratricopeptide repeat protein [Limnothrix redekei]|uniref:Tetratricopeptide repeat protein n=1 Tax=Limnothrix redekei LRLZ20PSL1 TaxID=3112953 RepID=A0ABW7CED6_9CYAN
MGGVAGPIAPPMPTIQIREVAATDDGFTAEVTIAQDLHTGQTYPVTLRNPFQNNEEADLEFFFEEWYQFPTLDRERADRARAAIAQYGQELFGQLLKANPDAYADYRELRRSHCFEQGTVTIEIIGSPEFQGWHWEAMRDPELSEPLSLITPIVRRDPKRSVSNPARVQPSGWLNLLVVTARPGWSRDVNYRTISRPLVEAIANAELPVKVALLRPGTWEALERHLQAVGPGFYHAVHFDLHGSVLTYNQANQLMKLPAQASGQTFRRGHNLGDLPEYDGYRAFLSFEGEAAGQSILVEAAEVAALLQTRQIPLCILNACQSAKQICDGEGPAAETSLGAKLLEAGMQAIVAMRYSVMVRAAELMMTRFYQALFTQQPVMEAIRLGRRELWQTKTRPGRFNLPIELEDWLLPVVYSGGTVNLNLRPLTADEEAARWTAEAERDRFEPPTYGFVGRDTDILELERRLLQPERNALLLQGMGGTGKTTLLRYLRDWWQRTGLIERSFYFGYDERAHSLEQIAASIFQQLDPEGWLQFQSWPLAARLAKLTQLLRSRRYALILDNLESVTAAALSIPNSLPESEQRALAQWLRGLVGGKTLILLGSRGAESWLEPVYGTNRLGLRGLDADARTTLAQKILERQVGDSRRIAKIKDEPAFGQLMKLLDGYPLAMEVVLGNLKRQTPSEILAGMQAADVNLDNPQAQGDKTQSIIACIDYSHGALSASAQQALLCLAPFSGFINCDGNCLEQYAAQLAEQPALAAWFGESGAEILAGAVQEAVDWGLLSPISPEMPRLLTIQPTLPYFLKLKLDMHGSSVKAAINSAFHNHCLGLASAYYQLMQSSEINSQRLGSFLAGKEYENIHSAVLECLKKHKTLTPFFCLYQSLFIAQDYKGALLLSQELIDILPGAKDLENDSSLKMEACVFWERLAFCQCILNKFDDAKKSYLAIFSLCCEDSDPRFREMVSHIIFNIGNIHYSYQELTKAEEFYELAISLTESSESQSYICGQIANIFREKGSTSLAENWYQRAYKIIQPGSLAQGVHFYNYGLLLEDTGNKKEAMKEYEKALLIFNEYRNHHGQACVYQQKALIYEDLGDLNASKEMCKIALEIRIQSNDEINQADIYHQLGRLCRLERSYEQALAYFEKSLSIDYKHGAPEFKIAKTIGELGLIAQCQERFPQALDYFLQTLQSFLLLDNKTYAGQTLQNLARLYQQTQDPNILTATAELLGRTPDDLATAFTQQP